MKIHAQQSLFFLAIFSLSMFTPLSSAQILKPMVFWPSTEIGGNNHFYQAVVVPGSISWTDANLMAIDLGGHLATLTSSVELNWVFDNVIDDPDLWTFNGSAGGPWLGGIQTGGPEPGGGWEWVTGELWSFTNWCPPQPDNAPPGENYLHLFNCCAPATTTCWNDIWNDAGAQVISFIVEYEGVTLHPMAMRLSGDPSRYDHFYQGVVVDGGVNWTTARAMAEAMGGYLATLVSAEENDWVFNNIINNPDLWAIPPGSGSAAGPWIGAFQPTGTEPAGGWVWIDCEPLKPLTYTNWDSGQPDNAPPGEHYVHFFNGPAPAIKNAWNDHQDFHNNWLKSFIVEYMGNCKSDINQDCTVNVTDLLALLAAWGVCP